VCVFDPFLEQLTLLVVAMTGVLMGGFMGLQWTKLRALDQKTVKNRIEQYKDIANDYKKESQRVKGQLAQKFQDVQVEGNFNLDEMGDLGLIAKQVLPSIMGILPPDIQKQAKGFLNNPEMIDTAIALYKKHPEEVKNLLARFVKKSSGSKQASNKENTPNEQEIANYA